MLRTGVRAGKDRVEEALATRRPDVCLQVRCKPRITRFFFFFLPCIFFFHLFLLVGG